MTSRDEAIAQHQQDIAKMREQLATANPLDKSDRATLRKLAAGELRRLQRELSSSEQDLLNQDRGRSPTTEEGRAKKERRKAELQQEITQYQQAIANLNELTQKLK